MASSTLVGDVLRHPDSDQRCSHRGIQKRRMNQQRFHYPLAYVKGSARKAGEHLHSMAAGGEAEPSPPEYVCPGYTFAQPPPNLLGYGAGLARQTFIPRL